MKKLFAPGSVGVVAYARGTPGLDNKPHDPWLAHQFSYASNGPVVGASGIIYWSFAFVLHDTNMWVYIYAPPFRTWDDWGRYVYGVGDLNFPLNRDGEFYNYVTRPQLIFKGTGDQATEWLATH